MNYRMSGARGYCQLSEAAASYVVCAAARNSSRLQVAGFSIGQNDFVLSGSQQNSHLSQQGVKSRTPTDIGVNISQFLRRQ
jgi:hypothetical protein